MGAISSRFGGWRGGGGGGGGVERGGLGVKRGEWGWGRGMEGSRLQSKLEPQC